MVAVSANAVASKPTAGALRRRGPLLGLGVVSLLGGLWGGLLLLGLPLPTIRPATASDHGALMALGFLGTAISLERAVALRRPWAFAGPAASGAGGLALLTGLPDVVGWSLLCVASVVLVTAYAVVFRMQPTRHVAVMVAGAVCWYVATLLWLGGWSVPRLVPWLAGFLVLTIFGERLELARVAMLSRASVRHFLLGSGVFGAGLVTTARAGDLGVRIAGVGLLLLASWGLRHDVARRTVKVPGVTRFMAVCLLSGYAWLLVAGTTWLVAGNLERSVATYDVALHAVFLGFVMSMIFGHAPVIVPAVLGMHLPFARRFYAHVVLLHAALVCRLVDGDWLGHRVAWRIGGVGTELAILLFLALSVTAVRQARRR